MFRVGKIIFHQRVVVLLPRSVSSPKFWGCQMFCL